MPRYKINIKYDGTKYFGWQIQSNKQTIQGEIEKALLPLNRDERVPVVGAGRTDTCVHALHQVAHFDLSTNLNNDQLLKALNARLQKDIIITKVKTVDDNFHARYSATKRYYHYQCYYGENILFGNQAWLVSQYKLGGLNQIAQNIIGKHDFRSFSKLNKKIDNTICEIYQSEWIKNENMLTFKICGNHFLHHMVRYLVGTMLAIIEGKFDMEEFLYVLNNPQDNVKIYKAPPQGLILMRIDYEN